MRGKEVEKECDKERKQKGKRLREKWESEERREREKRACEKWREVGGKRVREGIPLR